MTLPYFGDSSFLNEITTEYILAICMISVTLLTVVLTWRFSPLSPEESTAQAETGDTEGLLTKIKRTRQEEIASQLTAGMSSEQLQEEKRIEAEQLAAIYSLLNEQGDKFNVNSMEEVQSQLKLYRP